MNKSREGKLFLFIFVSEINDEPKYRKVLSLNLNLPYFVIDDGNNRRR